MKTCNNCRQTNPPEAMYCRQCASPLSGGQQQQYADPRNQGGQQQQWNQPNNWNPGMQQQNFGQNTGPASSRASTAAILSFAGLFCCGILGIAGAIMGWLEVQAIKEGKSSPAGMSMAQMGMWVGILTIILNVIGGVLFVIFGALGSL